MRLPTTSGSEGSVAPMDRNGTLARWKKGPAIKTELLSVKPATSDTLVETTSLVADSVALRIRFRIDESGKGKGSVLASLLESEDEAIHGRATKARLGSLKVQQCGESGDRRRPRVVMLYLGGGDRRTDLDPKECENQHGCRVSTIHGVLLLELRL